MSTPIDYSGWQNWFDSVNMDIASDPSIPRYQWPWNDDDRDWIPDVLDSGILWATHHPIVEGFEGHIVLDKALIKNESPQGWNEQGNAEGSWDNANDYLETIWTDSKKQDNKWNQI